jgi:hypothetical protein
MKILADYENALRTMVNDCAEKGIKDSNALANAGNVQALYLYFKRSTESDNGVLMLIPDGDIAPEGFELATGEGLRSNVPYSNYFQWIKSRVSRLPILAYGA